MRKAKQSKNRLKNRTENPLFITEVAVDMKGNRQVHVNLKPRLVIFWFQVN